jgi:crossover junction endodeoxyribonuclease RusA
MTTTGATSPGARGLSWVIEYPSGFRRPMTLNDRMHWAVRHARVNAWKHVTVALARKHRLPALARFTVVLHFAPDVNRRRDVDNLVATLKAIVDGLVLAKVCPDDDHTRYQLTSPVIEPVEKPARLWVEVVELLDDP